MEGSSGRGSVEVCPTVQRGWFGALASAAAGGFVCALVGVVGATEAWWSGGAVPFLTIWQGTRTHRVLLPAFLILVF